MVSGGGTEMGRGRLLFADKEARIIHIPRNLVLRNRGNVQNSS